LQVRQLYKRSDGTAEGLHACAVRDEIVTIQVQAQVHQVCCRFV
jgi:hypothetical protein